MSMFGNQPKSLYEMFTGKPQNAMSQYALGNQNPMYGDFGVNKSPSFIPPMAGNPNDIFGTGQSQPMQRNTLYQMMGSPGGKGAIPKG